MLEQEPPPSVVPLVGARIPADHGLSGLGLIMQLAGTVFGVLSACFGTIMVIVLVETNAAVARAGGGGDNTATLWLLVVASAGVVRSMAHRAAGTQLIYGGEGAPFAAMRRYLGIAAIQTVVWVAFFALRGHASTPALVTIGFTLIAWPAALAILISLPRFRGMAAPAMGEDKGFEGASILMLIFGLSGVVFSLVLLFSTLQQGSELPGVLQSLILTLLAGRSVLHVIAGWHGLTESHIDRAAEATSRYGNVGVISALISCAGLLMIMMATRADIGGVLTIALVGSLLLAWPLIIRKFFAERQFADMLAGDESPLHRRAPDLGHTTLGWLLLGLGVMALSGALPRVLFATDVLDASRGLADGGMDPGSMMGALTQTGLRSPWWGVGTAMVQIWAAVELIRMTDQHRLVGSIYGVIGTAVAIYVNLPLIEAIKLVGLDKLSDAKSGAPLMFAMLTIGLMVPIATLILVNRSTEPTARARYRTP